MPDISLPEVHLPQFRLPDSLRDMNREDLQKAMADVQLPKVDLPKRSDVTKELAKAGKNLEKAGKDIDKMLPRRAAPSPLPFVFFGMLAGLFIGWFLASSNVTGPRIGGFVEDARTRVDRWRKDRMTDAGEDMDTTSSTYPDALRTTASGSYSGAATDVSNGAGGGTITGVGPGTTADTTSGVAGVSSERF